jgi:hypothetical protein
LGQKEEKKMKKLFCGIMAVVLFFALTSIAFSADEALTPEKISGIWQGAYNTISANDGYRYSTSCKLLITPNLNGIINSEAPWGGYSFIFGLNGQGDIVNNQLIIRDRENPSVIRLKAHITKKNHLEGDFQGIQSKGDIVGCKKIRELTDEEKQWPLAQLEGLLK